MLIRLIALLTLIAPHSVLADASDFNYLDIGYASQTDPEADGVGLTASYRFQGDFFAEASYVTMSLDRDSPIDVDTRVWAAGVGFVVGENDTASLSFKVSFLDAQEDIQGVRFIDKTGYQAGFDVRLNTGARSELAIRAAYRDLDIVDGVHYRGQLVFDFTGPVSGVLTVGGDDLSDSTFFGAGIRINF